jgi:outer membrane protein assembly factor BamB
LRAGPVVRLLLAASVAAGLVLVAVTAAGASTLVAAAEGWSQYQGDAQHTGVAPAAPAAPFRVIWTTATGIGDETHFAGIPAPVIAGGDAIVVDREDVTAVSLATGQVAWTIPKALGPSAPAALERSGDRQILLFTEGGGDLSSSASGSPTTSPSSGAASGGCSTSPSGSPTPPPTPVASGTPAAPERSALVAVDAATREQLWRSPLTEVSIGGPTVDGSTVLVGTDDGCVAAFALETGHPEWSVDLGDSVNTPIAAVGGTAFVAVSAGAREAPSLVAVRESDHVDLWQTQLGAAGSSIGAPVVVDGTLYAAVNDGSIHALEATTGSSRWAARLNTVSGGGAPAVSDDAVVIADVRGQVYRFDPADGDRTWDFAMNVPVYGSAVIAGSSVLVGDSDGNVNAIDLHTGERIWRSNVGDGLLLGLAVAPQAVVATRTGAAAGLVGLVTDPSGALISEQSPTIVEPVQLGLFWLAAAIPLVVLLVLAGRFLDARLGPTALGPRGDDEDLEPFEDDLA